MVVVIFSVYSINAEKRLKQMINNENIREILLEGEDLVPDDGIYGNKILTAWKMLYRLMDNVKTSMDCTKDDKSQNGGSISLSDFNNIIDYLNGSVQNIKNTCGLG
jgi:hypothetical protein